MEPTWESRDLPVLDAIVEHFDEHGPDIVTVQHIAEVTGLEVGEVYRAVMALAPTYVEPSMSMGGAESAGVEGVTDEARRAVGQWPSPEVWADRIVRGLLDAADHEPDQERRSRLRAVAEGLGGFGRDVLVGVLSTGISKGIGL